MSVERLSIPGLFGAAPDWTRFRWEPFREGVEIARLYGDGGDAHAMALLRYRAGARVPLHEHRGIEHILVLEGSQHDEGGEHVAGSLLVHGPKTRHSVRSEGGCVVLAIWERPVALL